MTFYVRAHQEPMKEEYIFPCFILITNSWDDYGYKTTFELQYYHVRHQRFVIGDLKIMDSELTENDEIDGRTILKTQFSYLEDNYASLGANINYYERFSTLRDKYGEDILDALSNLNDVTYVPALLGNFEGLSAFQVSLLREREAKSALMLGGKIINKQPLENISFSFTTQLKNADNSHSVNFNFDANHLFTKRIFGIIGKNGTGKTQFLSNLANSLSYFNNREHGTSNKLNLNKSILLTEHEVGKFDTKIGPPFGKVIALSYSMFDTFKRPKPSKKFSYIYCGLRNDKDEIDPELILNRHVTSLKLINKNTRGQLWYNTLSKFVDLKSLGYELTDYIYLINNINEIARKKILNLSSGHSILIFTLTELIANISTNSLILFDEPENHLHPNAISNLVNSIQDIIRYYNSYAIVCTHSPIVIQELPSKNVWIFERDGNTAITRPLDIESFGENLSRISEHIFETNEVNEDYKVTLSNLAKEKSFEEILELFENKLSLNAKIYLSSLYPSQ